MATTAEDFLQITATDCDAVRRTLIWPDLLEAQQNHRFAQIFTDQVHNSGHPPPRYTPENFSKNPKNARPLFWLERLGR